MAYANAKGLESAIRSRSQATGQSTALTEFFAERLIARLATALPDRWTLKGGYAVVTRLPDVARTTHDVDCALHSTSRDHAIDELEQAAAGRPTDEDFLEFRLRKAKPGYVDDLASLTFDVRMAGKLHGVVKLDVQVVRDARTLGELVPLRRRVDPPKQGGWPEKIAVIPVADHVAEKLVALYSVHHGIPSTRDRDLVDLGLFATYAPPRPGAVGPALDLVLARPLPPSVSVELPDHFVVPERFRAGFDAYGHGLEWNAAMEKIDAITSPGLAAQAAGTPAGPTDADG